MIDTQRHQAMDDLLGGQQPGFYQVETHAPGPEGLLPLTAEMLRDAPSGDVFGLSQNAGMGWSPQGMLGRQVLILSTQGGIRAPDGTPVALGYHTGHWEVGLLMQAAAETLRALGAVPFAGYVTDPCDGRSQGTLGMLDSLPYRNDAAMVLRRLIRSLPTRQGVLGVATCDKGLPAMMMALAGVGNLPAVLVPGGVTLPPTHGEDAGKVQTIGVRFSHGALTLKEAAELGCRACATPGGGCQFLGTAATAQVVGEALGLSLPHSALAPSGQAIWLELARASARALMRLAERGVTTADILTPEAVHNAMTVHAAFGGSLNLLLHLPAIAHAAGLPRPTVNDWTVVNRKTPRLVNVLPNGPDDHATVRVFLAGGVPEVMLHLRDLGLLHLDTLTVTGQPLGEVLAWWEASSRRAEVRARLETAEGIDPGDVIFSPARAQARGLARTALFPRGNLAPQGAVIKSTALDPSVLDQHGNYHFVGRARVFTREHEAVRALKQSGPDAVQPGEVLVLICGGPLGTGMEEIYQVTSALKQLPWGKQVCVLTDARFSGVSTGACIGHIGPEALAGGPIGKVMDGDLIEVTLNLEGLNGQVNLIGEGQHRFSVEEGTRVLAQREPRPDLAPHPSLPADTRLWAALQNVSGGTWGGCVYDADAIAGALGISSKD